MATAKAFRLAIEREGYKQPKLYLTEILNVEDAIAGSQAKSINMAKTVYDSLGRIVSKIASVGGGIDIRSLNMQTLYKCRNVSHCHILKNLNSGHSERPAVLQYPENNLKIC